MLDFGICRPYNEFTEDSTPTGSLRTRAPEVLLGEQAHSFCSDIWALGATVFNAVVGRFPLFNKGETPPRVSTPEERKACEEALASRIRKEWESRLELTEVPEPLRKVLGKMLDRTPSRRMSGSEVVEFAEKELAAFLRASGGASHFSPEEELDQLNAYLPEQRILALMPDSQKQQLKRRLTVLEGTKGLSERHLEHIRRLSALVQ